MAPPKRKRGRPVGTGFHPTDDQRKMVLLMTGIGIREDRMVQAIINPATKKQIDPVTLRTHFRPELDQGLLKADIEAGGNLLQQTATSPAAAIFWAKCRLNFREHIDVQLPDVETSVEDGNMKDLGRRIAFTLAMGGRVKSTA